MEQRVEKLEAEVARLSEELSYLKAQGEQQDVPVEVEQVEKQSVDDPQTVHIEQEKTEKQLVKVEKPEVEKQETSSSKKAAEVEPPRRKSMLEELREIFVNTDTDGEKNNEKQSKPQKTFEERMMTMLPRIFMIILILGILWGLKLASDYGYLTDALKIFGSYVLSIGIGVGAYYLEKKKSVANAIIIAMYGGTFIIGILATAAGAILYELLSLTVALVIALLYIAYGIAMSYVRKNEVLTGFVLFTSLLLPYLLEYMKFNGLFIVAYIVMIFIMIQFVIWKHHQHIALYLGALCSFIALQIVWATDYSSTTYFAIGFLLVIGTFLTSWMQLYEQVSKQWMRFKEGALFTVSAIMLFQYNNIIAAEEMRIPFLLAVLILYAVSAFQLFSKQFKRAFDVVATFSIIILVNTITVMDALEDYQSIMFVLVAFAGMMLGIRLRAPVMKVMNSILLLSAVVNFNSSASVKPFFQVDHMAWLLTLVAIIAAYIYAKAQQKEALTKFEEAIKKYHVMDIILAGYVIFVLMYIIKLDFSYISIDQNIPTMAYCLTAVATLIVLTLDKRWTGKVVPVILLILYLGESLNLGTFWFTQQPNVALHFMTYIVFIGVMLALLADLYAEGKIYLNWQPYLKKHLQIIFMVGMLISIYYLIDFSSFLYRVELITNGVSVIWNTLTLFIVASLALVIDRKKQWKVLKNFGYILLFIALFKLIFFDLAALELFIRAILFIVIGAIGMVLSGKLLKKDNT